ncbi:MAG TPA: pirin family protein [Polyangiales bacterium]
MPRIVGGQDTSDGAGVRLKRVIGTPGFDHLDPFLLLDDFKSDASADYLAGFPDHPHRGFETVTYMLADSMGGLAFIAALRALLSDWEHSVPRRPPAAARVPNKS